MLPWFVTVKATLPATSLTLRSKAHSFSTSDTVPSPALCLHAVVAVASGAAATYLAVAAGYAGYKSASQLPSVHTSVRGKINTS